MANVRAIRTHIKSVESTRKITKSMKMVSAAKLKRTQQAMNALRPYAGAAAELLARISAAPVAGENPFLKKRETKRVLYVLFVGNRGLCGVYNTALLKYLAALCEREEREHAVLVCGRWGRDLLASSALPVTETIDTISDAPTKEEAGELAEKLKALYLSGEADEIVLVYERYYSALRQEPETLRLLPIEPASAQESVQIILEPDGKTLTDELVRLHLLSTVWSVLLEAKTGEHSARMTAMTAATDNTEQLLETLNLELNHARQSAITKEITEIVGGANALKDSKEGKRA
ncbi:MAG: ATP synthase F1 subunit gamma [Oscillospiraceae bacterium]|nr:ATP synthase F1 subunit gamma [Oscillospiraceae bacterium]